MEQNKPQASTEHSFEEQSLQEVMEIERAAQNTIHNAEVEAQRIIQAAKAQAEALQAEEYDKWHKAGEARLKRSRHQADSEVQAIRNEEQTRIQQWLEQAQENKKHAVAFALKAVLLGEAKE
ncbi:MAG: hypothetical protein LLG44_10010 [Chloroflexi bacterium]|nr:hypothetical protein [Chloroflexota bacterium]